MGGGLDFRAEGGDAAIDAAAGDDDAVAPDGIHDGLASKGAAGALEEELQEAEFLRGEGNICAAAEEAVGDGVEAAIAELIRGGGGGMAAEEGLRAGDEFADAEGLGDVIVGAEIEAADDVFLLALCGEHEDGHGEFFRADGAADFKAVEAREHDIEDDEVRGAVEGGIEALLAVAGGADLVAEGGEVVLEGAEDGGVVFDDEDGRHGGKL